MDDEFYSALARKLVPHLFRVLHGGVVPKFSTAILSHDPILVHSGRDMDGALHDGTPLMVGRSACGKQGVASLTLAKLDRWVGVNCGRALGEGLKLHPAEARAFGC